MNVPFLDLKTQRAAIMDEVRSALDEVMESCAFAGGPFTETFEQEFAVYCGTSHAVGCGSGTEALWIAMLAYGIGPGDEVITVPHTFIATAEAISFTGATPVFVDVLPDTYNMDPALIEKAITPKTKAIIPVHLYGLMADMQQILEVARAHELFVIEDASQAHGAEYQGNRAGSMGDVGCFSFYPGKNLGAYGEAGAVTTSDTDIDARMRAIRDHGQSAKHTHTHIGWNSRMDGFQAQVLRVKLKHLDAWTDARRAHAAAYTEALTNVPGLVIPTEPDGLKHVYHIYAVHTDARDERMKALADSGIGSAIHYPTPAHLQPAYAELGLGPGSFPVAESLAARELSIPMFPELTGDQRAAVIAGLGG